MIIQENFDEFLKKQFIIYAQDVVWNRAVPDVRDGLKPVQRRILQSMLHLGLHPNKAYKKSARTVGDCLGTLHPHGDSSVYGAMVTMAQDFGMRYPLVDGQGNMGSIDGDSAAAMRYTEARLSRVGELMLQDIDKNTVDHVLNYDESDEEAVVLPTKFPNLIVNGNTGIAVGMASSFAPHNAADVYKAIDKLLSDMSCGIDTDDDDLIDIIQAPDFPTGGVVINPSDIREAYKTGRGRIIVRSKYEIEEVGKNKEAIVVTEIPYEVNKKNLVNSIADLAKDSLTDIAEVRDESSREGIRIVIELKKGANSEWILNNLFKKTKLQDSFNLNHVALVDGHPQMNISLKGMIESFAAHCIDVNTRKITYDLGKANGRKHIVDAIMVILSNLDEAIGIIRKSGSKRETLDALIETYSLDEEQANAIIDMRLWTFNKEGVEKYTAESKDLDEKIELYNTLLNDISAMIEYTRDDLKEIASKYFSGQERLTEISEDISLSDSSVDKRQYIKDEDIVITLSHNGLIKSVRTKDYSVQKRGGKGVNLGKKDDDFVEQVISPLTTHDDLLIAMDTGRIVILPAYKIPVVNKNAAGKYLQNYVRLNEGEKIISVIGVNHNNDYTGTSLLMVSRYGTAKRMSLDNLPKVANGAQCMSFNKDNEDSLISCSLIKDDDYILTITAMGMVLRCKADSIRVMGRLASGVRLMKFKIDGDYIVSSFAISDEDNFIVLSESGLGSIKTAADFTPHNRGGVGMLCTRISESTGLIVKAMTVKENEDLFVITHSGKIVRIPVSNISVQGRGAKGVRTVKLDKDDYLISASIVASENNEENIDDTQQQ